MLNLCNLLMDVAGCRKQFSSFDKGSEKSKPIKYYSVFFMQIQRTSLIIY